MLIVGWRIATVFPNLSFLSGLSTVRVWQPRGIDEVEVRAFIAVDRADDEVKRE